jgi:hypothetical protein
MPQYRVIIHGQSFRLNVDGKWEKMGFYTPRFVDAPDPLLGEYTALEEFRQSTKYRALMDGVLNADDDPPVLCGEDTEEVGADTGQPLAGLALYTESGDDSADQNAAPNGGPAASVDNPNAPDGPPSVS